MYGVLSPCSGCRMKRESGENPEQTRCCMRLRTVCPICGGWRATACPGDGCPGYRKPLPLTDGSGRLCLPRKSEDLPYIRFQKLSRNGADEISMPHACCGFMPECMTARISRFSVRWFSGRAVCVMNVSVAVWQCCRRFLLSVPSCCLLVKEVRVADEISSFHICSSGLCCAAHGVSCRDGGHSGCARQRDGD